MFWHVEHFSLKQDPKKATSSPIKLRFWFIIDKDRLEAIAVRLQSPMQKALILNIITLSIKNSIKIQIKTIQHIIFKQRLKIQRPNSTSNINAWSICIKSKIR